MWPRPGSSCRKSGERENLVKGEEGQAVAEFSLVLFLLVLMLFAILETGLLLNAKLALSSSAREVARLCAVEGGNTQKVRETLEHILAAAGLPPGQVEVSIRPTQAIYGTTLYVDMRHEYVIKSPVVAALTGPTIAITARAVTRSEFVPR